MRLTDFQYTLPAELIASYPMPERSGSRLLHLHAPSGKLAHRQFIELPQQLTSNDLLVFNNTRVIPARLFASKSTGGRVEMLVERIISDHEVLAHMRSSKSLRSGMILTLVDGTHVEIVQCHDSLVQCRFITERKVLTLLQDLGHIPLPHYMSREAIQLDKERYQTVYAAKDGAVAAPTAGLHFDEKMLQRLATQGIDTAFVTLHVGAGTFKPVKVENIIEHKMHAEQVEVTAEVCDKIRATRARGGRVIAVGTTAVRSLETASMSGTIAPYKGDSELFIYPGYQFRSVDALITNFHLPASTLLMLVSAFAGYKQVMQAYHQAIEARYRFFSYGDAMLITHEI
ncbi:tRNA preQ1(34) S-adenosylmethionine ribosyltransferase-isomerase QueA [soil metagenome]